MAEGLCNVRLRAWAKEDGTFTCRLPAGHGPQDNPEHAATGLYPWQTIYWVDSDRRTFRGEFTSCDESTCYLPAGHRGDHER